MAVTNTYHRARHNPNVIRKNERSTGVSRCFLGLCPPQGTLPTQNQFNYCNGLSVPVAAAALL